MRARIFPQTTKKAAYRTSEKSNQDIRDKTICHIDNYIQKDETVLSDRIHKLNYEWDIERLLETNAAAAVLLASIMGYRKQKCCSFLFTGTIGFFLLQHALQGWCPPLSVIRKLGVRTAEEIQEEKTALKWMRGDFSQSSDDADRMLLMTEKE
jgi:hypothetical protein